MTWDNKRASHATLAPLLLCSRASSVDLRDAMGDRSLLLDHILQTLAAVLHYAGNAPALPMLLPTLWQTILALRFHANTGVRRRLLLLVSVVVAVAPPALLWRSHLEELVEAREWCAGACSAL